MRYHNAGCRQYWPNCKLFSQNDRDGNGIVGESSASDPCARSSRQCVLPSISAYIKSLHTRNLPETSKYPRGVHRTDIDIAVTVQIAKIAEVLFVGHGEIPRMHAALCCSRIRTGMLDSHCHTATPHILQIS